MEHKFYMMVVCRVGGSPPPYVASPRVDPRLDSRGGNMHVRNRCRGAMRVSWRKLGLIGPRRSFGPIFGRRTPCDLLVYVSGCILEDMLV